MKKRIVTGCLVSFLVHAVILVILVLCFVDLISNNLSQEEIYDLVNENHALILDDIKENDFSDTLKLEGVQKVFSDTEVIDVYCGGVGAGSGTGYYGFYYSPDNLPKDVYCGESFGRTLDEMIPEEKGFAIKNSLGYNYYYTEKIRDNFYYYEAHF